MQNMVNTLTMLAHMHVAVLHGMLTRLAQSAYADCSRSGGRDAEFSADSLLTCIPEEARVRGGAALQVIVTVLKVQHRCQQILAQ